MRLACVLGAVLFLVSFTADADTLSGTRFEVREVAHRAWLTVDRGFAKIVVERVVRNPGTRSDQALFFLDVPEEAVATRLRTAGTDPGGHPVWFEGELMDAEKAAVEYQELTGIGGYYPKDPALLSFRHRGRLALQVFPVPPEGAKTVEYELSFPMRYEAGKYRLDLTPLGTTEKPATLRVAAAHQEDHVCVNGVPIEPTTTLEASRDLVIDLERGPGPRLSAELATVPVGDTRALVHARALAAARLGQVPRHAAVAVVLDTSRSMAESWDAERAAAVAYLSSFEDAEVTIVTFDRKVALPLGHGVPGALAVGRLAALAPAFGNGSQVDDAIVQADAILRHSNAPAKRMLVLTDLMTRHDLTGDSLSALKLVSGALIHLSTVDPGSSSLVRDDDADWARLPRRTGGVFWHASALTADTEALHVFDEWARPKRLDHVTVIGFPSSFTAPDTLAEGTAIEAFGVFPKDGGATGISLEGELWSAKASVSAASTALEEKRWSALVFGNSLSDDLTEDEQRILAMKGGAVSPMTSYLAIEPGVRPSTDGLDWTEGFGDGGGGSSDGIGLSGVSVESHGRKGIDKSQFLRDALGAAFRNCGGAGTATVRLESTRDEIVHVGKIDLALVSPQRESCLREATWALMLPAAFDAVHEDWTVDLGT